ncbi:MAG: ATP-binding protein [Chloroflexota bacterium]
MRRTLVEPEQQPERTTRADVASDEVPQGPPSDASGYRLAWVERPLFPLLTVLLITPPIINALDPPYLHPVVDILLVCLGLSCLGLLWLRIRTSDRSAAAERQRTEADRDRLSVALGRERATLASVIASMGEGLAILDADRIVRFANRPAATILGVPPGSTMGLHVEHVIGQLASRLAAPEEAFANWRRVSANPESREAFEVRLLGQPPHDGARDVHVQIFPVPTDDDARAGVGLMLRDVTHERDLDRVKDEIIAVVNHELRTPLASVVGFAELMLSREFPEEQRRRFLTSMVQEGRRLAVLVDDLLDLQRLAGGTEPFAFAPCAPRPLLEHGAAAAGPDPARPITVDASADLPPVRADARRVQQVLSNLLGNARKYTPNGGAILLSAQLIDDAVEIAVTDQGLGIPADALPRLFEKFYRVDNSDRREIRGTGLGLAIVRQIVEVHGGRVHAESAGLGHGTRMSFTLPIADVPAEVGDVLIVEDDVVFGRLLEVELEARGLTARRVETGAAALAAVRGTPPRAVMLDLILPDTTGHRLLTDFRTHHMAIGTVVIITQRDLSAAEHAELTALGTTRVMLKQPGVAAEAASLVAQALRTSPTGAPGAAQPDRAPSDGPRA